MALTQKQIKEIFKKIDDQQVVSPYYFKRWPAWPLVRERLWFFLQKPSKKASHTGFSQQTVNVFKGCFEGIFFLLTAKPKKHVFGFAFRSSREYQNYPHLGDFFTNLDKKSAHLVYGNLPTHGFATKLTEVYTGSFLYLLAHFFKNQKKIKKVSQEITQLIVEHTPKKTKTQINNLVSVSLTIFYLKYLFFSIAFKKIKPEKLIIQDPDGKPGEVLAAKALGIKVVEVQHGIFEKEDIDYSWNSEHLKFKESIPTPDEILVFGEHWKKLILGNKFFDKKSVNLIRSDTFYRFRNRPEKPSTSEIILFFPTQPHSEKKAMCFWSKFLSLLGEESKLRLWVKVHPNDELSNYTDLIKKNPKSCKLFDKNQDPYELLFESTLVVGYNSSLLLEALALKKQVVILSEGGGNDLFQRNYGLLDSPHLLAETNTPENLLLKIKEIQGRKLDQELFFFANSIYSSTASTFSNYCCMGTSIES